MFNKENQIEDPRSDDVGQLIKALSNIPTWTKEKQGLYKRLVKLLKKKKYMYFVGHPTRYHLTKIGDSCLYQIPINRRGKLSVFRGKLIRVVCVSSGRFSRLLMAAIFPG